jgi:hypothetical protein
LITANFYYLKVPRTSSTRNTETVTITKKQHKEPLATSHKERQQEAKNNREIRTKTAVSPQ